MVGNHRTIYNESLIYLSLKLNPFSKKSEPIRILYPFHSPFTKWKNGHFSPFFSFGRVWGYTLGVVNKMHT